MHKLITNIIILQGEKIKLTASKSLINVENTMSRVTSHLIISSFNRDISCKKREKRTKFHINVLMSFPDMFILFDIGKEIKKKFYRRISASIEYVPFGF